MIPAELLTMGASVLVSALLKLWKQKQDNEVEKHRQTMEALTKVQEERAEIRANTDVGYTWTRRALALSIVFSVIVLPKMAAVLAPNIPITIGWTEFSGGFWPFTDGRDLLTWHVAKGLVITPLDTHTVAAVIGLYFGGSLAGHRG